MAYATEVLRRPNLSPDAIGRILDQFWCSSGDGLKVLRRIADHPGIAKAHCLRLLSHPDFQVLRFLAENPSCDPSVLRMIVAAAGNGLRAWFKPSAACNPGLPLDLMLALAVDRGTIAGWALRNPALPLAYMERIVRVGNLDERVSVALNPSLPHLLMSELWERREMGTAHALVNNSNTPGGLLGEIARRYWGDRHMMDKIARHDAVPLELVQEMAVEDPKFMEWVLRNPDCPSDILIEHASDYPIAVAGHPSTPPWVLESVLFGVGDEFRREVVKLALAGNPSTPEHLLLHLADDESEYLQETANRTLTCANDKWDDVYDDIDENE